jgi:hypothetical protein
MLLCTTSGLQIETQHNNAAAAAALSHLQEGLRRGEVARRRLRVHLQAVAGGGKGALLRRADVVQPQQGHQGAGAAALHYQRQHRRAGHKEDDQVAVALRDLRSAARRGGAVVCVASRQCCDVIKCEAHRCLPTLPGGATMRACWLLTQPPVH